jgi:3-hydroxybutyryl-CoA dehydrogenase
MGEIAIVGAGTMGHGLALVFALGGHRVRLTDSRAEALDLAPALMRSALATLVEGGEAEPSRFDDLDRLVRLCPGPEDAVAGADVVIEAIVEDPAAKRALFERLDGLLGDEAVLASNTSYLDVFPLVPERLRPRALVMHWYTPPYIVDLVDVVPGPQTAPEVVRAMREMVLGLGQRPIVLGRFVPGYVANRIQSAITLEVLRLLDEGVATAAEIDDAVVHGLALRMPILGHLAKADFTGLDLMRRALANRTYEPPPHPGRSATVDALCAEGRTGVMAGRGFFDWGGRDPSELFRERDRRLLALKRAVRRIGRMEGA